MERDRELERDKGLLSVGQNLAESVFCVKSIVSSVWLAQGCVR